MISKHLTDEEIQLYALDKTLDNVEITLHVSGCKDCQEKVSGYQLLFASLKQQEPAVFDFDLASAVLEKMAMPVRRPVWINPVIIILSLAGLSLPLIFLIRYREVVAGLFTGLVPFFIPLVITASFTTLVFLFADMYKQYRKKMTILELG